MQTDTMTFDDQRDEMLAEGYRYEPPAGIGPDIDANVCAESACGMCGKKGLEYHPFSKPNSYRAFAVCGVCGFFGEF